MITTNDLHELKPLPFMHVPGVKAWRTAGLDVWRSYFLLSYASREGRTWVSQGMILGSEEDLRGFCDQIRKDSALRVYEICKLVPPQLGQCAIWSSVSIKEIWDCARAGQQSELHYIAKDGKQQTTLGQIGRPAGRRMHKIFEAL